MSYLDVLIAIPLVFGLIRGFMKGMIVELTSIMALILGIYSAILLSNTVANFLHEQFDWSIEWTVIIAFILVFAGVLILVHLLAKVIERGIKLASLGLVNKLAGSFIGFFKMGLVVSALLLIIDKIDQHMEFMPQDQISKSVLYKPVADVVREQFPKMAESNAFQRIKKSAEEWNEKIKDAVN
jgi:membrane protein required for colicin V production